MISGTVTRNLDAVIRLTVRGPNGQSRRIRAVIDTGFDGCLTLPSGLIAELELPWHRRGVAELADGSETIFDVYRATVFWNRRLRAIRVDEAETWALVGMELLMDHELNLKVYRGGAVTIRPLRPRRSG